MIRAGLVSLKVLRKDQIAPSTLAGLEDFLQKAQTRATGYFLMESLAGVRGKRERRLTTKQTSTTTARGAPTAAAGDRATLFRCFELYPSPSQKLRISHDLQRLAATALRLKSLSSLATPLAATTRPTHARSRRGTLASQDSSIGGSAVRPTSGVSSGRARRALSMYENLEEGEAAPNILSVLSESPPFKDQPQLPMVETATPFQSNFDELTPTPDAILAELEASLLNTDQNDLLLNLQLVSAFAPSSILNVQDQGKAFWDLTLAVLSVRRDELERYVQENAGIIRALPANVRLFGGSQVLLARIVF